jgi:hypothetical protein
MRFLRPFNGSSKMNGYYYAAHPVDGTTFIVYLENSHWYCVGIANPIAFDTDNLIGPVPMPDDDIPEARLN